MENIVTYYDGKNSTPKVFLAPTEGSASLLEGLRVDWSVKNIRYDTKTTINYTT